MYVSKSFRPEPMRILPVGNDITAGFFFFIILIVDISVCIYAPVYRGINQYAEHIQCSALITENLLSQR